jgi:hypothetical protein
MVIEERPDPIAELARFEGLGQKGQRVGHQISRHRRAVAVAGDKQHLD